MELRNLNSGKSSTKKWAFSVIKLLKVNNHSMGPKFAHPVCGPTCSCICQMAVVFSFLRTFSQESDEEDSLEKFVTYFFCDEFLF
jgi:hypothetical protein